MVFNVLDNFLSFKEQKILGLYNVTTNEVNTDEIHKNKPIRLHETVNPFEIYGIFESTEKHLFITKYTLCVYEHKEPKHNAKFYTQNKYIINHYLSLNKIA
jgi:hypothetical protein